LHFISTAVRAGKEAELLALEQGDMTVSGYEDRFISLSHFTDMFQTEKKKARMFERGLRPQFKKFVFSQRLHTLGEVVDSAKALELESVVSQKSRETTSRSVISTEGKEKGKRPFVSLGQGGPGRQEPTYLL